VPSTKETSPNYQRRRPELTPCFKIINKHLDSFIADRQAENRPLPAYVTAEFEAFLKCGILAYGFLRLKCQGCTEERIVAFSCKKRGFCPSCCAKRKAETAAHLVDSVLPLAPYRQMVLSFPIPLRYWLHTNKKLFAKVVHHPSGTS
jgi:Transposase zinc-binding domain